MIQTEELVARLIGAILSWLDASNLRNRLYRERDRNETLRLALEDIARIDGESLGGKVARQALELDAKR